MLIINIFSKQNGRHRIVNINYLYKIKFLYLFNKYSESLFKILLLGDSGVGKSCIIIRYIENNFSINLMNSIGVDFKLKNIEIDSKKIKLQIWDTAGQERFKTITTSYYKGAHAILIVFDITDHDSFDHIRNWMADIDKFAKEGVLRILVGNKCDLQNERKVSVEEAKQIANKYGIEYIETSAKDTINIDDLFISTAKYLLSKQIGTTGTGKGTQNGKNGIDLMMDNNQNQMNNNQNSGGFCC